MLTTHRGSTEQFLDALERRDVAAASAMLAPDAAWVVRMTADGTQDPDVTKGRDQVVAGLEALAAMLGRVRFVDRRISDVDGRTVFVQANGDFRTSDGRPYRNVYVFRFDWRDGQLATWEEYANPVTIGRAFGLPDRA